MCNVRCCRSRVWEGKQSLLPLHFISFSCIWRLPARMEHSFKLSSWEVCTNCIKKSPDRYRPLTFMYLLPFKKKLMLFFGQASQSILWAASWALWNLSCVSPVLLSPPSLGGGSLQQLPSMQVFLSECRWWAGDPVQTCGKVHRAPAIHTIPSPLTGKGTPYRKVSLAWRTLLLRFNSLVPVAVNPLRAVFTFRTCSSFFKEL